MSKFKVPSLFIKEIALLPRIISDVKTSIPVFIGYTKKITDDNGRSLVHRPVKLKYYSTYVDKFGTNSDLTNIKVELDANNNVTGSSGELKYYLSSSVRHFFKNGGEECYIISCGKYGSEIKLDSMIESLSKVTELDEPSLIAIPDALKLENKELYKLYRDTLKVCSETGDKFAVLNLKETEGWRKGCVEFRENMGSENLNFGAAYSPHLTTSVDINPGFDLISNSIRKKGRRVELEELAHDAENLGRIYSLKEIYTDIDKIERDIKNHMKLSESEILSEGFSKVHLKFLINCKSELEKSNPDHFDILFQFSQLVYQVYGTLEALIDKWNSAQYKFSTRWLKDLIESTTASSLIDGIAKLNGNLKDASQKIGTDSLNEVYKTTFKWESVLIKHLCADVIRLDSYYLHTNPKNSGEYIENMRSASYKISEVENTVLQVIELIRKELNNAAIREERFLENGMPVYKDVKEKIKNSIVSLPPSGAVCGAYAQTDKAKGFWRAPANITLKNVEGLSKDIGISEQQFLYIDSIGGKSVNPIREFDKTGRVIWGARTLAGNNPKLKYIPIQRAIMIIEKSIFRGTLWVMFEPNNSETWLKVSKTVQDYLNAKYKIGMLQGLKPEHAYFVKSGLGTTMTAEDIKEGRIVIEYGVALLRPSEFFTGRIVHKIQNTHLKDKSFKEQ